MKQSGGEEINAQNTLNEQEPSLNTNDNSETINTQNTLNEQEPSLNTNDNSESINYLYLYSRGGKSSNKKMKQKGSSCGCSKNDIPTVIKGVGENMQGGCLDCPSGKKKVLSYLNVICKNVSNIKKEFDKSTNKSKGRKGGDTSSAYFDLSYLDLDTKHKFEYSFVEGNKSLLV
jgi:hypothetical protein